MDYYTFNIETKYFNIEKGSTFKMFSSDHLALIDSDTVCACDWLMSGN